LSDNPSAAGADRPGTDLPGSDRPGSAASVPASVAAPAEAPGPARPGGAWALLVSELTVLFRRRRTWALLLALAAVPVLIVSIPLFLPLTVGVVAGDTIAGEAGLGTLRYLLVAPAGRGWLLVVKYVGAAVFCLAATVTVVMAGVLAGLALFPVGPLTLLSGDTISLAESFGRALLIAGYVTVSLLGLSAIGMFFSTLTVVPVGAMAATIVLSVVAQVLDSLPQLDWLHPWQPIDFSSFGANALLQGGYLLVFGALAYGRFVTKDILS
jgi:ABC-2 type transport system permease protein